VAGIGAQRNDYAQTAIVTTLRTDQPLDGTAHERFTTQGPMALLPLRSTRQGNWHGLVWAAAPDEAIKLLALDDAQFMQQWQQAFGWRAGAALQLGRRASYPLSLQQADATVATRAVLLGNASQALHPVAGQGFNLGLRDAAELAEVLAEAVAEGLDPGSAQVLARFEAQRGADRQGVVRFTDALVRVFSDTRPGVAALRDLGLLEMKGAGSRTYYVPGVKFVSQSMVDGAAGVAGAFATDIVAGSPLSTRTIPPAAQLALTGEPFR
jgi:2-octaprenyl-6-methoxyphenol hydroxylase